MTRNHNTKKHTSKATTYKYKKNTKQTTKQQYTQKANINKTKHKK